MNETTQVKALEAISKLLPGVAFAFDFDCITNEFSKNDLAAVAGYGPEEIGTRGPDLLAKLVHPDDLPRVEQHFDGLRTTVSENVGYIEYRVMHKDGSTHWVASHDRVLARDRIERPTKIIGISIDVSSHKATVHELEEAQRMLKVVFQTAGSAIIAIDADMRVQALNDAARHVLGGIDNVAPFSWPTDICFLDPETLSPLDPDKDPVRRSLDGKKLMGELNLMTRKTKGQNRYVRVSSTPADTADGVASVIVLEDVSEQEMTRQQMERASRLDALGQLTGGIAHDFNNLLATIQYSIDLAMRNIEPGHTRNLLNTALGSVDRGAALSRRLLAFARRQPGLAQSNLLETVRAEFMALVQPTIEETIEVSFEVEHTGMYVFCDQGQLENAILNLVLNSRDAIIRSGRGDKIMINARSVTDSASDEATLIQVDGPLRARDLLRENERDRSRDDEKLHRYVEIAVTDNGPGMTDEVRRRAVDPFFTTKDTNSGTGLGLSMVYGFVQQSGGELRLYSEVGQGTAVRMMLPRGTAVGSREGPVAREPALRGGGETILVVEDEPALLMLLSETVRALGYKVACASNGTEAMSIIDDGFDFDLLLTDIVMPGGMSGFALARNVRQLMPDIPIVYMSGYSGYDESEMGEVVAPMLPKPCPEPELSKQIHHELNRQARETEPAG